MISCTLSHEFSLSKHYLISILLGSMLIAISAQVTVPMWPVPASLQTLAVLGLGLFCSRSVAIGSVLAYIFEASMGMPVLVNGMSGWSVILGTTAGYIWGFIPLAWIASLADHRSKVHVLAMLTLASIVQLTCGYSVLTIFVGIEKAWLTGVAPFVYGSLLKILVVYGCYLYRMKPEVIYDQKSA